MRVVVVRSQGARLAVPLLVLMAVVTATLAGAVLGAVRASAADKCTLSPDGIDCWFSGSSTSTSIVALPPIRYLATTDHPTLGRCWFWSRYPPGLDAFDGANDEAIIRIRFEYPRCPAPGSVTINVTSRAWEVFRSFPLRSPVPRIRPSVGITNLTSLVTAIRPTSLHHSEVLPDGRVLEVEAHVGSVPIVWGDGRPSISYPAADVFGGGARHAYALKTCPPGYRTGHPAGPNCHPVLAAYPVTVSFAWTGRYRTGGAWTVLGTLYRSVSFTYDVDEVVGLPVAP